MAEMDSHERRLGSGATDLGAPRQAVPATLDGGGSTMDWTLFAPDPHERNQAFSFGFERDDGSGRTDYLHIPLDEIPEVIEFFEAHLPARRLRRLWAERLARRAREGSDQTAPAVPSREPEGEGG